MALQQGYKFKDGKYYCHHLDLNFWSGPGNNRKDIPGQLNQEILYHKDFPGVQFRVQRRHSTHQNRAGGRGFTAITNHTPESRPYDASDPHYGPFRDAEQGRFTDHNHLFFGGSPVLNGLLTNDPYPAENNPHEFHLARQTHTGSTNLIKIGGKTWGNRSLVWVPDIRNWDGEWSSGHDFNPYWASIDSYNGQVPPIPQGLKVMLKAEYASRDGKKPEYVFRAEGLKDEGGYYRQLRVTLVFPRYYDSNQDITGQFNPDWWRWALPAGEDGSGRWKFAFLPDVLGDFTLIEPVKISTLSTNWTTKTQQLLAALDADVAGHGYHAEMLPDFSTKEDFPMLPDAQTTLCHIGGLMKSDGTRMPWKAGAPVENQANDKESIAENIKIEVINQAAFDQLVQSLEPYPAPIMVTSPNNLPEDIEPPTPIDPCSISLEASDYFPLPGTTVVITATVVNQETLEWGVITPEGNLFTVLDNDTQQNLVCDEEGEYVVICEAVNAVSRVQDSILIVCAQDPIPPDSSLEDRVEALEDQVFALSLGLSELDARVTAAGTVMQGDDLIARIRRAFAGQHRQDEELDEPE